ncbi:MAG: Hsp33 family molecular chaperone HslO [Acidobacteria bacterium]|nr:MAG: Hsp33 family molecular chaperone HslO [Acidobacteriota bacterium]REK02883.1 MAG: Hsp33 family molecular chaperone HslO [Acidobacteriota bacterium]REK13313.1 MAG: Hsp33 family molecular chaperone HslO [Acidobacteriota bacterium]REK41307.1 MAG: Hsp33 family molecular chaperone HslO [Acidobacteriota bacterium]
MGRLIHGIAEEGTIRVIASDSTDIVAEAVRRHKTAPTASAALGRVLTGTLLLGASFKDFDRLTVKIESEGEIGGIVAEADANGNVRGYAKNPSAEVPAKQNGKFDVRGIVGEGMFYVIRESGFDIGLHRDPYVGSVPIVSGEIAEDFAYYLARSEQIPSAVLLGVLLNNSAPYVRAAGGVMIQMLPGADERVIKAVEAAVEKAPHLTTSLTEGATAEDLLEISMGGIEFEVLHERETAFKCNCSHERALGLVSALGEEEVRAMLEEDDGAKLDCGFCNETYELSPDDLRRMLRKGTTD